MNQLSEIRVILWDNVSEEIKQKIKSGAYKEFNGVVRDMSKATKPIALHLPMKAVDASEALKDSADLLKVAQDIGKLQTVMTGLVAVSTVAILGAIVVSTAYLSHKIDKLQDAVTGLQKDIKDQNVVYYAEKIANYFGAIEALREVISSESVAQENRDLIMLHLANLGVMRNQCVFR